MIIPSSHSSQLHQLHVGIAVVFNYKEKGMDIKKKSRIAGILYLGVIASGLFSEIMVRQALQVPGDPLATVANIRAHETLYRWGVLADLFNFVIGVPILVILYGVFRKRFQSLALLALSMALIQTGVNALNLVFQLLPLNLEHPANGLSGFNALQISSLTMLGIHIQAQGYGIGLAFFGVYCMVVGYILYRGKYVPPIVGVVYALAGVLYILNTEIMFLDHGFRNPWFMAMMPVIFLAEFGFTIWLLVKGLKEPQ